MNQENGPKFHTINDQEWLVHKNRFEFITSSLVDRQFEIDIRQNVQKVYEQMEKSNAKMRKNMGLKQLALPSEIKEMKFSDILKEFGTEQTSALLKKLMDSSTSTLSSSERQRTPDPCDFPRTVGRTPLVPPSQYVTPAHRGLPWQIFEKNLPTTVKKQPPRQAKPGEPVFAFSSTGSPVIPSASSQVTVLSKHVVPPTFSTRIKQDVGSGAAIDVDLVWRGAPNELKNKFQADFRTWAEGWTTVKGKKLITNTISKKKPPAKHWL